MSSLRQQIAVQKLSENIRNTGGRYSISMGTILREAGYSEQTSLKPKLVTESKGYKEELDKIISIKLLAKTIGELLSACKLYKMHFDSKYTDEQIVKKIESMWECKVRDISRNKKTGRVTCHYQAPNEKIRIKAAVMILKINGCYPNNKPKPVVNKTIVKIVNYKDLPSSN